MNLRFHCALIGLLGLTSSVGAININIDYSYDTGFFNNNSTARASIEAAADFLSEVITDDLNSISTPPPFVIQGNTISWSWNLDFSNPATGNPLSISNPTIEEDEYRIYVGARNFTGNTLGVGGAGGWGAVFYDTTGNSEFDAIDSQFENDVRTRGETSGFSAWGGSLSFDTNSNWHFDHTTLPANGSNSNDFYSVAIHELVHALGLGGSSEWNALASGGFFTGSNSRDVFGSSVPLNAGSDHWAENTMSRVYGGTTLQEALLDPTIQRETRKELTELDAAALVDIGWTLVEPQIPTLAGDYNNDGIVDVADFTVFRDSFGSSSQLDADGSGNGVIDIQDYNLWASAYSNSDSSTASIGFNAGQAVPEPHSSLLAMMMLASISLATRSGCVRS